VRSDKCSDKEQDLGKECNPCRTNKAIYWDKNDISNDIEESNKRINIHHLFLFSLRYENISVEGRYEIYEKYWCDNF
jgi:hypothetical protein